MYVIWKIKAFQFGTVSLVADSLFYLLQIQNPIHFNFLSKFVNCLVGIISSSLPGKLSLASTITTFMPRHIATPLMVFSHSPNMNESKQMISADKHNSYHAVDFPQKYCNNHIEFRIVSMNGQTPLYGFDEPVKSMYGLFCNTMYVIY